MREKLMELLESTVSKEEVAAYGEVYVSTSRVADHLIANGVTIQKWIPVSERLPDKEGSYLVYTERGSVYASHFYTRKTFHNGYVREAQWSQRGKVKVTHWMPLPEPPKGV